MNGKVDVSVIRSISDLLAGDKASRDWPMIAAEFLDHVTKPDFVRPGAVLSDRATIFRRTKQHAYRSTSQV